MKPAITIVEEVVPRVATQALAPVVVANDIQISGTVVGVRHWLDAAARFERCKTACQVMAGFELRELKARAGFVQGGTRQKQKPIDSVFATWGEFVRHEFGISDDTARGWIAMAEALRPRLKKLPGLGHLLREILDVPMSQMSPAGIKLLTQAVHKLADGRTQLEFMLELGITKAPQGSAAKGGNLGGARGPKEIPDAEAVRKAALEDWTLIGERLYNAQATFTLLDDARIEALTGYLDDLSQAMKSWLRTAKAARDSAMVELLNKSLHGK